MNKTNKQRKGAFSELFFSTQKASIRPSSKTSLRNISLPPLEDTTPPEDTTHNEEDNEPVSKPSNSSFPNISTYTAARKYFSKQSDKLPPSDPLPMGPHNTPPESILPKVQIPFITPPGVTPRSIEVERLKRQYQQMDISQLLIERGIDYPQEIGVTEMNTEFPPIFQLWDFDDDSFDPRTTDEWLSIGLNSDGTMGGIPSRVFNTHELKWIDSIVIDYNSTTMLWQVKYPNDIYPSEWLPRLRILFLSEDPRIFSNRIANAINERRRIESWIRFVFYVENMPYKSMPKIPKESVERILQKIPSPRRKIELDIKPFLKEAKINYKYTFNTHSFEAKIKSDPIYARSLGIYDLTKEEEIISRNKIETNANFKRLYEKVSFHSLYTKDCIFNALMKTRSSCLDVSNIIMLSLRSNKSFHLEEFQQTQSQMISKNKHFLTDDWVPQLGRELRNALSGISKGWFNLEETDREVYNMSKFSNFMTLISFMMIDAARKSVLNNFELFDNFIEDLSPISVTIKSQTEFKSEFPKNSSGAMIMPLFEIDMTIEEEKICYGIDPILFKELCLNILSSIVDSVRSIPIIEPRVLPEMFRNVSLTLSTINEDETELIKHKENIIKNLDAAIKVLEDYILTYDSYIDFLKLDHAKFVEKLNNDSPSLEQCSHEIKIHQESINEILKTIPKRAILGLFSVNVTSVRNYLISKHKLLIKSILDYISKTAKSQFKKYLNEYRTIENRITAIPTKIEELDQQRQYISTVPKLVEKLHLRVCDSMKYYDFLENYNHQISNEDFNIKWNTFGHAKHCFQLIEKSKSTLDNYFIKFEQDLEMHQEKFAAELDKLSREVSTVSKYIDPTQSDIYSQEIKRISKIIENSEQTAKVYNSRQIIFGQEITDYSRIDELKKTFEPFALFWLNLDQWYKLSQSINEKPLIQLNAEQISKDLQVIYTALHKSTHNFKNGPTAILQLAIDTKQKVSEMRDHIPLLTALLNPGMKKRHWVKLSEKLGFEFQLDDEITLNDVLQNNLEEKIDVIIEVVSAASKEYSIETSLQKMQNDWEEINLDIEPYKNTGTYILKGSDDIIQKLDDDMVMINTMEFSPYKKPFEDKLNKWEQTLKLITSVIEEWLNCQRSWLSLEPIFSSDDIKKQLPTETERFESVDKTWRKILDSAYRSPSALKFCPSQKLLDDFKQNNKLLSHVERGLNDYLESKRVAFPRFYFLSNDELLSILSQTKDPTAVQRHLRRCFENIGSLTFEKDLKITQMISCEGEVVNLSRSLYPKGNVEHWLLEVETIMRETLKDILKKAYEEYPTIPRIEWVLNWPAQIILCCSMIYWTKNVEEAIKQNKLLDLLKVLDNQLIDLTKLVRETKDFLKLRTLSCLIVLDVHAHDIVEKMVRNGVNSIDSFEWISQLRYYYNNETAIIKMLTYEVEYGYEYLGNTTRLVITPLTDRCYLTLTSALQMNMGGAPQGPAGTGKTETTKDLAKAVAFQCVVYNCSESVDYLQMGIFLTGLASCGAWACFDEFNRIYIEVLSVIAQQITTIQNAIQAGVKHFRFENRDVPLSPRCAVFITMNPGYAGRTELPDNLKALFRSVSMMVPDYKMIAKIKLYSFGFIEARKLSEKIVATFRLSSEQLSSQKHYDFGMRAVNTVIQNAGNLRMNFPDMSESLIILRAIKDVNVPKFLKNDLILFNDIISDLFPGIEEKTLDYSDLINEIHNVCKKEKLQVNDLFINKIIQLKETFSVRWGVMLVGPTGSGKTTVYQTLSKVLTSLSDNKKYFKTRYYILNPKSITMGQLYGEFDLTTHEWTNGVLSDIIKTCSEDETNDNLWIVLDGPVDALWIENMNTVLDDNKKLCLSSSAVINFTDRMFMLFEVEDLAVASPATVSRCSGRQSLTKLAAYLGEYEIFQPQINKNYGTIEWLTDIKEVMKKAGLEEQKIIFLISDSQIIKESFLEDINNLLNSGDVPNIFQPEDMEEIIEKMKPIAQTKDIQMTKASLYSLFISRVKEYLHLVLAISPIGESFRRRLRMFPSLVTCTSIDWFNNWDESSLTSVATEFYNKLFNDNEKLIKIVTKFCVNTHLSIIDYSQKLYEKIKRNNYVTPTSFLDFLDLVKQLLDQKTKEMNRLKSSMETGLSSLKVAASSIKDLQEQIKALQPQLEIATKEVDLAMERIRVEESKANEIRIQVQKETELAEENVQQTKLLKEDTQKELDKVLPVLEEAKEGVKGLTSSAISTVRSYLRPPETVGYVMQGVCILLNQPVIQVPGSRPGEMVDDWWATAQKMLNDPKFKQRIELFTNEQKDNIPESTIQRLQPLLNSENFTKKNAENAGSATLNLYYWVIAMNKYHFAIKLVRPKQQALEKAEKELEESKKALQESKDRLQSIEEKISLIKAEFDESNLKKKNYQDQQEECKSKLIRAESLLNNLSGEKGRWEDTLKDVLIKEKNLIGDILIASASVAYLGPFPSDFRNDLLNDWRNFLIQEELLFSDNSNIIQTLQDPIQILKWNLNGLPRDSISLENIIILTNSKRWPLCIDPQGQANRFIKNLEKDNQLDIIKLNDDNLIRTIENAVRFGKPLLIENVLEELDPILDPILQKQIYKQSGADVIKIGDTIIPYNWDFKLYITTQLPNPNYSPELSAKVSLLDFTCTQTGLEEQLLALTVAKERPDLEEMKSSLVIKNSQNKKKLHQIQTKMLSLLENTDPNKLLDDLELINTLTESNQMSQNIQKQVKETEETEIEIDKSRQNYQKVAFRGSLLFFCISNLFLIDPMYQYSLEWYISFFGLCINNTPNSDDLEIRLNSLINTITINFYNNICRSMFERHKQMFSFLLCYKIMQSNNEINSEELRFLISGPSKNIESLPNPDPSWITIKIWNEIKSLDLLPNFKGFLNSFIKDIKLWKEIFDSENASKCIFPNEWQSKLTEFQRLLILRVIRPDSIINAIQELISNKLGNQFLESPQFDLNSSFSDSTVSTPLIFILSVGADPLSELTKFAEKKSFGKKFSSISLGQGQGPKAEAKMIEAMDRGHWLLLQNCHLAISWLPKLEMLIENIKPDEINRDFRLWLTSMPSKDFPVSILQKGIKMTNEPPKGIRSNLLKSMSQFDDKMLNDIKKLFEYHKLIYALCFFHAIILERRKYGSLGFNQIYDWNNGDLEISQKQLKMFLNLYENVPFKVLKYLTGEINYGGKVTDDWDRRTLLSILDDFYTPKVMNDNYQFTENPNYLSLPEQSIKMYLNTIKQFPINDSPDLFGLHSNAEITYQQNETFSMFNNLLLLQSSNNELIVNNQNQSKENIIYDLTKDIIKEVPKLFDQKLISEKYPQKYSDSMNTVLIQQTEMFNKLITIVTKSLKDLLKALKGIIVMNKELEDISNSIYDNFVPKLWENSGYPSTKPLSSWIIDLKLRVKFFNDWIENGPPLIYWISGFFIQQSFLTGIKQNYARKTQIGVDTVSFAFDVINDENEINERPNDGVIIKGLFIEGAAWDRNKKIITDPNPKELYQQMPPIKLIPVSNRKPPKNGIYNCPLYKIGTRKGQLSTTGHSTNYVMTIELPSDKPESYWIKRGVAMICSLSY
ncbi:dynein heavy chain 1, axonemal [Histomonas meleagridis]|uniref:dynein heavy chain 1, axonemal n=1 Tax=Histomonas meleagridis TaxID=135588 RepID=UPI00355A11D5|nr:dynein heavy chain 1, axonemal [Histomonas meleagridis]KAH0797616.1 dynein heavy chain 1, axonemal [Histomonas meleagridis]